MVECADGFVELMRLSESHKYLGNSYPGDLRLRGSTMLANRIRIAWGKFHQFKSALLDKHVDLKLRVKLFNSVVTACVLYGLVSAPLTRKNMEMLAVVQRKMLRSITGYVNLRGDDWSDFHRRMNSKLAFVCVQLLAPKWEK